MVAANLNEVVWKAIVWTVVVDMKEDSGVVSTLEKDSPFLPFEVLVVETVALAGQQCLTVALSKYVLDE